MEKPLYKPRPERWPQVSLRALFVLVTLLDVFLGWLCVQMKWIRGRHGALADEVFVDHPDDPHVRHSAVPWVLESNELEPRSAPWSLRLFGEKPVQRFIIDRSSPTRDVDLERLQRLFPEAEPGVWVYDK